MTYIGMGIHCKTVFEMTRLWRRVPHKFRYTFHQSLVRVFALPFALWSALTYPRGAIATVVCPESPLHGCHVTVIRARGRWYAVGLGGFCFAPAVDVQFDVDDARVRVRMDSQEWNGRITLPLSQLCLRPPK